VTVLALRTAVDAVDWNKNKNDFFDDPDAPSKLVVANMRLAVWARQLEIADRENPALCFVREMQAAGHHVAILAILGLYKVAAASMRAAWDGALYYSYFRTHPVELATLARDTNFFVDKREILEFHKQHTTRFSAMQTRLGLISRLDRWYGLVSSIIHGQQPGAWATHQSFEDITYRKEISESVVTTFVEGSELIHRLFLCTVGQALWRDFSRSAKRQLLSGLSGDVKTDIALDSA